MNSDDSIICIKQGSISDNAHINNDSRDSSESKRWCFDLIASSSENVASQVYVEKNKSKFLQLNFLVEYI